MFDPSYINIQNDFILKYRGSSIFHMCVTKFRIFWLILWYQTFILFDET